MDGVRNLRNGAILTLAAAIFGAAGCNSDMPFELLPVHGKVTYEDGSLIPAGSILVTFNPIPEGPVGPITAPGGKTQVNVADGTFAAMTSRRPEDGVVAGRHKVVVVSFEEGANGMPKPSAAIPAKYRLESTTPIEVDVTAPDQFIEIKVSKK